MAVSVNDIAGLKDKKVYETSNEKIVLTKDYEKITGDDYEEPAKSTK